MRLENVLRELVEIECVETLRSGWDESLSTLPTGVPSFLDPIHVIASRRYAGLPDEVDATLQDATARIAGSKALRVLIWHAYRTLCDPEGGGSFDNWPTLEQSLGDLCGTFYMLVGLAAVPHIRELHGKMGVPEDITRDTCHVLVCLSWNYDRSHPGRLGIMLPELSWVRNHLQGRLFRIGRLEFMIGPFQGQLEAYRHRASGRVIALAADGARFDERGYLPYRGAPPGNGEWVACLKRDGDRVEGSPISPWGVALQRQISLSLRAWRQELSPGQLALEFHIPEGGGMTPERCLDSMRAGLAFFAKFFPDTPVAGFHSSSWIFGPQLEEYLPGSANLVKLLQDVYLYPIPSGPREGLYYLFGSDDVDLNTAPRDTSLRRATLEYLAGGGSWRCGGMFIMGADLTRFGSCIYRSDWDATLETISQGGQ
jgi:hypothetical protein